MQQKGVTLIELVAGLAILAIVAGVALPGFSGLIERERVTTASNTLLTDIQYARSLAVTRGSPALLCPSTDGESCTGGSDWTNGWIVFVDDNDNRQRDPGEDLLRVGQNLSGNGISSSIGRPRIRFQPDGSASGSNATITLCDRDGENARAIIISNPGRARVSHTGPGGRALEC